MVQIDRTALEAQGFEGAVLCAHAGWLSTESSTSRASVPALAGVGSVAHPESVRRLAIGFVYQNLQDPRLFAGALPKLEGTIT